MNESDGVSIAAGVSRHNALHAARVSVSSCPRAAKSSPSASYSSRCQPVPTPRSSRPCESTSSVAACFASNTAGRSGAMRMPVANRTRVVAAAIAASTVIGSSQGASGGVGNLPQLYASVLGPITTWSTTTTRSTPAASAARARSMKRCHSSRRVERAEVRQPDGQRGCSRGSQATVIGMLRRVSRDDGPMRSSKSPGSTTQSCCSTFQ